MKTEESEKYIEWLTTIANTRFIYNTMEELETMMDNRSIHSNGIRRCCKTPQKMRSAFRDLKVEVSLKTDSTVSLEQVMTDYKHAWDFFHANLARRSNPKQIAWELLAYCYPPYATDDIEKRKKAIYESAIDNNIKIPYLILMLMKALPGYDSKEGDVTDMAYKYEEIMEFMEEFTKQDPFCNIQPAITQARDEQYKSRLTLLFHVTRVLNLYESFYNPENTYTIADEVKERQVNLNIDGFWNESNGKLIYTDFWQIESALNNGCYFATHWHKDADNRLTGKRFSMFLLKDNGGHLIAYIIHPQAIKRKLSGLPYTDADHTWYAAEMPEDIQPLKLTLIRNITSSVWKKNLNLTRVTDNHAVQTYNKWLKKCEIYKPYGHLEYCFHPALYAITQSHLYISSENEGEYFKVPRNAGEAFSSIRLDDNVGIMTMGSKSYLVFDELLLYIPIKKSELERYHIQRVSRIE